MTARSMVGLPIRVSTDVMGHPLLTFTFEKESRKLLLKGLTIRPITGPVTSTLQLGTVESTEQSPLLPSFSDTVLTEVVGIQCSSVLARGPIQVQKLTTPVLSLPLPHDMVVLAMTWFPLKPIELITATFPSVLTTGTESSTGPPTTGSTLLHESITPTLPPWVSRLVMVPLFTRSLLSRRVNSPCMLLVRLLMLPRMKQITNVTLPQVYKMLVLFLPFRLMIEMLFPALGVILSPLPTCVSRVLNPVPLLTGSSRLFCTMGVLIAFLTVVKKKKLPPMLTFDLFGPPSKVSRHLPLLVERPRLPLSLVPTWIQSGRRLKLLVLYPRTSDVGPIDMATNELVGRTSWQLVSLL